MASELVSPLTDLGAEAIVVNADDPSTTAVVRYTVQPGAQFPWHTHAGPVVVNVVAGALTYVDAEGCTEQTYTAGQAFVDPGHGHAHSAFNPTGSPTILIATFFQAPASGLTVAGFVARLWIWPPPCGVNGCPRKISDSAS